MSVALLFLAMGVFPAAPGGSDPTAPLGIGTIVDSLVPGADIPGARTVAPVDDLVVDVEGGVPRPGLHRLRQGDRVGDAIEAAGGFAPRADLSEATRTLNLAAHLTDGAKVLVPELGAARAQTASDDRRIDLNQADRPTLESLPGVGPVTAQRIIDARAEERFDSARELRSRGLVGESVFSKLKDLVRAGG
jgi:competence protein ComEA